MEEQERFSIRCKPGSGRLQPATQSIATTTLLSIFVFTPSEVSCETLPISRRSTLPLMLIVWSEQTGMRWVFPFRRYPACFSVRHFA